MSAAGCIKNMQEHFKQSQKTKRSLTCFQFRVTRGAIIYRGILAQIFATGAAKVHHYQIWRSYHRDA